MPFNVDPGVQQAPKYQIDPIRADTSAATLVQGVGNILDTAVESIDNSIKADISNTLRKEYELDNTIFGVDGAATMESNTKVAEKMGTDTPEGIRQAQQQLTSAREAVQQGRLRESNYQSRLVAVMRQLRVQYPGYAQDIDTLATQITGQNPEHAARRALMSEWQTDATQAQKLATDRRENIEQWGENGWLPPNWQQYSSYEELQNDVYKRRAMDTDLARQKSNLELKAATGKASQQEAMDVASAYIRNTQALQFTDTLKNMGIGSWDDLYTKLQEYKADGVISPEEQQQITQVFDQLQQASDSAFNQFLQSPLSNEPGSKSIEAIIQDSSKIEDLRKMAQRELDQMKNNFLDGKLGLFAINKVYHDNLMDGASLEMARNNPTMLMLNALARIGGNQSVEAYIRMHPDVFTKLDTKSKSAFFHTMLGSNTQGTPLTENLKAIDTERGIDPTVKGSHIESLVAILKDPDSSQDQIRNVALSLFGPGNLNFMTTAPLNEKDKERAFRFLTSPEMSQFMFKNRGTNPQGWSNYVNWVAVSSRSLYQQAADTLQSYVVDQNTPFTVNFDGSKFVITNATPNTERTPFIDPTTGLPTGGYSEFTESPPIDLTRAVEKLNIGLANVAEVSKLEGKDPTDAFKQFNSGLRLNLSAKKNPTFWDTVRSQVQKLWSKDTPESDAKRGAGKLGSNANPNGAAGAIARMAAPVANAIQLASATFGHDETNMKVLAFVESAGDPSPASDTGSYKGLYQMSNAEFERWKQRPDADIYNAEDNAMAAAAKLRHESDRFETKYSRPAEPVDIYLQHQQGVGGYAAHMRNPDAAAWENMYSTREGQQKGENWARQAIWGNMTPSMKALFPGGVDTVTSGEFIQMWQDRLEGFGATPTNAADLAKKGGEGDGAIMGLNVQDLVGTGLNLSAIPQDWERPKSGKSFRERALKKGRESDNIEDVRGVRESIPKETLDATIDDYLKRKKRREEELDIQTPSDSEDIGPAGLL